MIQFVNSGALEEDRTLQLCRETAGFTEVFAACFYGSRIYGDERADVKILLILPNYTAKLGNFNKQINSTNLSILAIDKKVFEEDVKQGRLGELVAEILILPYQPWINPDYLEEMEIRLKKRIAVELLKNIILQYPELSAELLIKPEYFMYEVIRRRTKLFPHSMYNLLSMLTGEARNQSIDAIMRGYSKALKELEAESCVLLSNSYVKIDREFIEATKQERTKFSNIFMSIQRALLPYIRGISSKTTVAFLQYPRFFARGSNKRAEKQLLSQLGETERYLLMPTPLGPVPLSDKTTIQDFVRKTVPGGEALKTTVEEMGGVLNSVFVLKLQKDHETQKIVVKMFEDWLDFKWFPLALWTLGTQSFAVLGETRLEREYSINQFLREHGINVPRILYVSLKERLIFEDFVEGEKMSETLKQILASPKRENNERVSKVMKAAGREIAKVHSLGVALGDCKPENMLVTEDEKIYFLDLEQATRNGNEPWDIAEFLYYAGHYFLPIHPDEAARIIASSFVEGYLEAGGRRENVSRAASPKYTKVFSIFTLPHIIWIMANICKRMGKEKA